MKSICCPSFLLFKNSGVDQLDASGSRSHLVSAKLLVRSVSPLKTQVGQDPLQRSLLCLVVVFSALQAIG